MIQINLILTIAFLIMSCQKPTPVEVKEAVKDAAGKEVYIRIFKKENILELWTKKEQSQNFELYKTYEVCTWSGSLGPKLKEGDGQSPEGFYTVGKSQLKPDSTYHRAFNIGFPNSFDRANGRTGSFIMVHGGCVSIGCYAMTDKFIEEIYYLVESALDKGQSKFSVHIFPFRMNAENMSKHKDNKWLSFWQNLKEGYDLFEQTHTPPEVTVKEKKYFFR